MKISSGKFEELQGFHLGVNWFCEKFTLRIEPFKHFPSAVRHGEE
jgi:hypothetical protein